MLKYIEFVREKGYAKVGYRDHFLAEWADDLISRGYAVEVKEPETDEAISEDTGAVRGKDDE